MPKQAKNPEIDDDAALPNETLEDYVVRKNAEEGLSASGEPVRESRVRQWDDLESYDPHLGAL